jgi:hypothetical protein
MRVMNSVTWRDTYSVNEQVTKDTWAATVPARLTAPGRMCAIRCAIASARMCVMGCHMQHGGTRTVGGLGTIAVG